MGRRNKWDDAELDFELADISASLDGVSSEHGGGAMIDEDPVDPREVLGDGRVFERFGDDIWT